MLKEEDAVNKVYNINRKKLKITIHGFTLVELLAVVVILGLILAIAVPRIMDLIDNTRESAYQINEGMMISAARNYLVMDESKNPSKKGTISIITIEELQNSELISSINDAQDSNIECDGYVVVKNVDATTFDYTPHLKCGTNYETEGYLETPITTIDVLIVAGGGGGGGRHAGGGGAGGLIYIENFHVSPEQIFAVTVGNGGLGGHADSAPGANGGNSLFDEFVAIGGGGGGAYNTSPHGRDGGSGGGEGRGDRGIGKGVENQGHNGGYSASSGQPHNHGGGGGAGSVGHNGNDETTGDGGIGLYYGDVFSNEFGENGWFAGGGGGGSHSPHPPRTSLGGKGGGGNEGTNNGLKNTGGGGGGGTLSGNGRQGGKGGSGIILVRYPGHQRANGGTITTFDGYTIHAFTEVGESVFEVLEF